MINLKVFSLHLYHICKTKNRKSALKRKTFQTHKQIIKNHIDIPMLFFEENKSHGYSKKHLY